MLFNVLNHDMKQNYVIVIMFENYLGILQIHFFNDK